MECVAHADVHMNGIPLFTARQVARLLGIHPQSVLKMIWRKSLPAVKVGRSWRITTADLETLVRNRRVAQ